MDRRTHILCFSLIIVFSGIINSGNPVCLKSCILSPKMEDLPSFRIYYQGMKTTNDKDGLFTIPLENGLNDEYSLLICKEFSPKFESVNTIDSVSAINKKMCKFYTIKKASYALLESEIESFNKKIKACNSKYKLFNKQIELRKKTNNSTKDLLRKREIVLKKLIYFKDKVALYEQKRLAMQNESERRAPGVFWLIKKKLIKTRKFAIPENCVVVCINPKMVRKIENWNFSLSDQFISFPRIVLKDQIEMRDVPRKKSIVRSSRKSILDLDPFFEQKKIKEKQFDGKPKVIATLQQ